ncbi:hypothetical protein C8A05DRAFT_38570 [Staphylotrichum tortipilum]|uniref:Nephrocystin 3-like N-terminal domain-containing protein n=1 Tax=Staphylotrichum tortipilum TaxID=2831512 RepID=A0AAN6MCK1_9PEZI|nr:hypothetical protein C8A05DRAFT_38570 [Staphylotrichum longicolle]
MNRTATEGFTQDELTDFSWEPEERGLVLVRLAGAAGPMNFRRKLQWPLDSKKMREILDKIKAEIPIIELAVVGDSYAMTLCCTDPTVKHVASRKIHQPSSNTWTLDADAFKEWKTTPGQALWLHGIPGAGKTIICSTIIDHKRDPPECFDKQCQALPCDVGSLELSSHLPWL